MHVIEKLAHVWDAAQISVNDLQVSKLGNGAHNQLFQVICKEYPHPGLALLMQREDMPPSDKEFTSNQLLAFLHDSGFDSAPIPVFSTKNEEVRLTSFVEGSQVDFSSMSDLELNQSIDIISQLHSLSWSDFKIWADRNGVPVPKLETPISSFEKYGLNRLTNIINSQYLVGVEKLTDKLWDIIQENQRLVMEIQPGDPMLIHGDFAGGNMMRRKDGKLILIDWEHSRWTLNSEIGYLIFKADLSPEKKQMLLRRYADNMGFDYRNLSRLVKNQSRIINGNDAVWALDHYHAIVSGQVKDNKEGPEFFLSLCEAKVALEYRQVWIQ